MTLVFLGGENWKKVFVRNFFDQPREILRPAEPNPFLSGQAFKIPVSGSFHTNIGTLFC